jgi:DNA-binding NtrC family response regulator
MPQPGSGARVLIVDDDHSILNLVSLILRRAGFQVDVASGGRQAIELIESDAADVDLLLTDIVMPDVSGIELAELCARMRPDIPVLFMTGFAEQAGRHRHRVIEKPFTIAGLVSRVRDTLGAAARN